ncbi:ankyrin repeat-containing protein At5g02620-like [Malania oleifera]|uniref:ankyrin repeat-containing protein At5g02620-like n=1 Tax=Malania oleifera TaxID=397392 RepID=UPI0025AE7CAB|nr:ankyrin repeat-containing protein At5g02620-like [Malania oleifera]
MEAPVRQQSLRRKKITKQLTGKRDDTPLHSAARAGNLEAALELFSNSGDVALKELLSKQNQAGETALYVAAEYGYVDLVSEMIKHYDIESAGIRACNGFDAFHIAAKQGDLEVLKALIESIPELIMTFDLSNSTALQTAAAQGHVEVVNFLLEKNSGLATIARSNGKTSLHSAARNGHLEVVKALLGKEPGISSRTDKKGQTVLHMAVKGLSIELVNELIKADPSLINMVDTRGNTALHTATRKGRAQIVRKLLNYEGIETKTINKAGETALDTAEKSLQYEITTILENHGVQSAKSVQPQTSNPVRELKQTVSDIKHGVHDQLEHTRKTRKRVRGIAKQLNKMHAEGLNNAIGSTTLVAVLIATVAFAAIFTLPGQFADKPENVPPKLSLGEANIAPTIEFLIFFICDSFALFISLAVVLIQTSIIIVERKAKKQMMAVINKLMWLACVFVSVAFLALSYIIVGKKDRSLAIGATVIGTVIMAATLGTMCYWIIANKIEASKLRSNRRSSMSSRSLSYSISVMSDSDIAENKKLYAI